MPSRKDQTDVIPDFVPVGSEDAGQNLAERDPGTVAEVMPQKSSSLFKEDDLRTITSFDDAIRLLSEATDGAPLEYADQVMGDGFAVLKEKGILCGVPLIIMEWSFYPGEFGAEFVAARVVTRNQDGGSSRYIINDGSSGICKQLRSFTEKTGKTHGLLARRGLRSSTYDVDLVENGKTITKTATTFYIDTAA